MAYLSAVLFSIVCFSLLNNIKGIPTKFRIGVYDPNSGLNLLKVNSSQNGVSGHNGVNVQNGRFGQNGGFKQNRGFRQNSRQNGGIEKNGRFGKYSGQNGGFGQNIELGQNSHNFGQQGQNFRQYNTNQRKQNGARFGGFIPRQNNNQNFDGFRNNLNSGSVWFGQSENKGQNSQFGQYNGQGFGTGKNRGISQKFQFDTQL